MIQEEGAGLARAARYGAGGDAGAPSERETMPRR